MENHRIKVKLGDAEFDAEGSAEVVQAQYEAFLAAIASITKAAQAHTPSKVDERPADGDGQMERKPAPGEITADMLNRLYRQTDHISLAALPTGEGAAQDAMLAILYGYFKLDNQNAVTGTTLAKAAKTSGVNVSRVDRVMASLIPNYVLAAGVKKARRYQLNNRGIYRAEDIIREIFQ